MLGDAIMVMIRVLFLVFFFILSCGSFFACSEGTETTNEVPTVRLVNHGIESGRKEDVVFSVSYSLEIDEPLDHRLFLLVNTELYMKNHDIHIESDEIFEASWMGLCIIEKGRTNSGKYIEGFIVDGVTRVVLQLLPAKDRLDPYNLDGATPAAFPPKDDETFGEIVRIHSDYKFKPYQLGCRTNWFLMSQKHSRNQKRISNSWHISAHPPMQKSIMYPIYSHSESRSQLTPTDNSCVPLPKTTPLSGVTSA